MVANTAKKSAAAKREERRKKIAANLIGGLTYRQIAEACNCSLGTVANDVRIVLGRWRREQIDNIEGFVLLQLVRLDRMLNAIWNKVLDGDLAAIDRALKIMDRQAKLLGLDEPEKHEHFTQGTTAVVVAESSQWADMDDETLGLVTQNLLLASAYDSTDAGASLPEPEEITEAA
jgi:hypothetical protein